MYKGQRALQPIDLQILKFTWKWKCLSLSGIAAMFFGGRKISYCYVRLMRLKKAGFLERAVIYQKDGARYYWMLTKKGFQAIRSQIHGLKEDGFKSEHVEHDFLVSAFHLGEWAPHTPKNVNFFSEQQLRRLDPEAYPDWVPKSQKHRADGYWRIGSGENFRAVAIEIERNIKDERAYFEIASFYAEQKQVSNVLWVVDGTYFVRRIEECARKADKQRCGIHSFVLERQFLENGWSAPVIAGPGVGRSVSELLYGLVEIGANMPITSRGHVSSSPYLDARINLRKLGSYLTTPTFVLTD